MYYYPLKRSQKPQEPLGSSLPPSQRDEYQRALE